MKEAEEATARGELVPSVRRFVEELERSRTPYKRKVELLEMQIRLAKEQKDHLWLKSAALTADRCGFKSRQWICDNIYDIGSRRDRSTSMRTQQINETFGTQAVRDFRLREDSSVQLWVSDAREDKSPSITQEEEERLLASSPEISIYAEGDFESDSTPQPSTAEKPSSPEDKGARPKEFPTRDARLDQGKKSRVAQPKVHPSTHRREERRRRSPSAGEWRLISGEKQLFRIPADQISLKHRTRSERRSPSGTRSDHRSPPRRRDDHRQLSVRFESKRGRSSPPSQRHGNSPTRQRQSKRSRHHRGHGPSHNSELSSRLSDSPETCEVKR